MLKKLLVFSCSFALLVFSFEFCFAATWLDPALKWKTIETVHFYIHFHDGEEEIARRFAPVAEEVHEKLVKIIQHQPEMKTNVLLLDTVDYGNGYASVFPYPAVTLYLTDWSTNLNPSKYELWLKFLFTHEYTHILHLDICEGYPSLFKLLFGRIIFPNALEPWFMIEGLATYSETKNSQWGRGEDPRWEMMMRMDILEDNVKSIDQAAVGSVHWPMGHLRYLCGVEFLEYLAQTYGEDKLVSLAHLYGDFLFSYGIDGAFAGLYQKSLNMLWNEWIEQLRDKYEKQKQNLGKLTSPQLATHSGYYNLKPKWSRDSDSIFYQQWNADFYPNIRLVDLKQKKDVKIFEGLVYAHSLSLDPSGRTLLFTKQDTYKNFYTYKDLYVYGLQNKKLRRLTEGLRVGDADFSPDGERIVFVKNERGTHNLMLMDSEGTDPRLLCSDEVNVQYFSPRWSPDGTKIAVAKWTLGGEQKIYLVDPKTGKQERLTLEQSLTSEANPCFSPDGEYVFFDSDRSGIVNLYAFHLRTKQLYQVTNVLGGAMMPDLSLDGARLAYVSYSSKGYDIAVMELEPSEWKEVRSSASVSVTHRQLLSSIGVETTDETENRNPYVTDTDKRNYETHDYNPLPTLLPKFWLPLSDINENGSQTFIYTAGADILSQHYYLAAYNYDFEGGKSQYSFLYANNQFLPQIAFQITDASVPYSWDSSTLWMREKYDLLSLSLYDNRVFYEWDRQVVSVGYETTNITNISSIESLSAKPSLGNVNGAFLVWRYLSARDYAKSISPEDGIDLNFKVTFNSLNLGSDYAYTAYSASGSSYFSAPLKHHVFAPTLYGFYSRGDQLEQSNFSWKYLPVRGYPGTGLRGNKGVLLSTEYRFPISYAEKGIYYGTIFFDKIWGNLFFEIGGATTEAISNLKLKRSYGAELNVNTLFMWGTYGVTLKLGYVKGLDEGAEEEFYFTVGL